MNEWMTLLLRSDASPKDQWQALPPAGCDLGGWLVGWNVAGPSGILDTRAGGNVNWAEKLHSWNFTLAQEESAGKWPWPWNSFKKIKMKGAVMQHVLYEGAARWELLHHAWSITQTCILQAHLLRFFGINSVPWRRWDFWHIFPGHSQECLTAFPQMRCHGSQNVVWW